MYDIKVALVGVFLENSEKAMGILEEEFSSLFEEATSFCFGEVVRGTPIYRGTLADSHFREVRGTGMALHGVVATPLSYAGFIETGEPAHYPNFDNLMEWVRTSMGLTGGHLYAVTNIIARRIATVGVRPHLMYQKAFETAKLEVPKMIDRTAARIIARWNQ